jgi:hypothetical protein
MRQRQDRSHAMASPMMEKLCAFQRGLMPQNKILADRTLQFCAQARRTENVMAVSDILELMIALRFAELHEVAAQLLTSSASLRALADSQPDKWAEQLGQIGTLWDYQGRLPAEFAAFVAG